jgi:hypothetical protein
MINACHRLKQEKDAAIIIKFLNLADKEQWLSSATKLKNSAMKISICQDTPPILTDLKLKILKHRKTLTDEIKSKTKVHYHKTWPYITMKMPDGSFYDPKYSVDDLLRKYFATKTPAIQDAMKQTVSLIL